MESSDGEHGVSGVPASCGQQRASSSSTVVPASSSTVQAPAVVALDLTSIQLQCGAAGITVREKLTEYERSQMDPHRIRKLLSEKCGCREGCFSKLKPKESQLVQVGRVCPPSNFRYPLPCPTVTLVLPRPHTVAWRVTWRCCIGGMGIWATTSVSSCFPHCMTISDARRPLKAANSCALRGVCAA